MILSSSLLQGEPLSYQALSGAYLPDKNTEISEKDRHVSRSFSNKKLKLLQDEMADDQTL